MKQIGIKTNGSLEVIHSVPITLTPQIGDSLEIRAIVTGNETFLNFTGWITGTVNPVTKVVDSPGTITINVNTMTNIELSVTNSEFIDAKTLEYDVMIKAVSGSFVLGSYQVSFDLNALVTGTLTTSLKTGTSELTNIPAKGFEPVGREIGFAAGTLGADTITTTPKRIGRMVLASTDNLPYGTIGMVWDFDGAHNTIIVNGAGVDVNSFCTFIPLPEKHRVRIEVVFFNSA